MQDTENKKKRVAIIGAGFTGLTAAYELAKKGFDIVIYERANDIGGLAGGFTVQGTSLEKAYHHLFRTDTDILTLVDELGLHEQLKWFESKVGMVVRNTDNTVTLYPFNGVKDLLTYTPLSFFDRVRAGAVLFFLQKYTGWKNFIKKSAVDWMTKWSGTKVMEKIWGPLLKGKFSEYAPKVSMAWLWARIHIRANSRKSIFEKELLAYPHGGFHLIAQQLLEKTAVLLNKNNSDILKLSATIERISYENGAVRIICQDKTEVFDAILSTIPEKAFISLLEKETLEKYPSLEREPIDYLSAVVLTFTSEQSLSKYYWHNIIDQSSPFLVFLQHTNLVPKDWYDNKNLYYIGVYVPQSHRYMQKDTDDRTIISEWFSYLKTLFPNFEGTKAQDLNLFRFSHAQHVVDIDYPAKIPPYHLGFPHTFTANFAQIFPEDRGTNYAVREGRKIAETIAQDLLQ